MFPQKISGKEGKEGSISMTRKPPTRHNVRSHKREGKSVRSFIRGSGTPKKRISKVVGKSDKYPWTECQLRHPSVQKKILACVKQIKGKTGGDDPFTICQASISCPPKVPDLPEDELELMKHLINDPARRIYVHLRKDLGASPEEALNWFEEHAQWGEIPGVVTGLGNGLLVNPGLRRLFGVEPLAYLGDPDTPTILPDMPPEDEEQERRPSTTPYGFSSYATREEAERWLPRIEKNLPQYKGRLKIVRSPQRGLVMPWMIKDIYEYT